MEVLASVLAGAFLATVAFLMWRAAKNRYEDF